MLNMLDVAIGFATVMLAVSLIIMSITQATSSLLALRGAKLRMGLEQLIKEVAPSLKDKAEGISNAIVQHPLVSDSAVGGKKRWNWASAIKREELIPVLTAVAKDMKLKLDQKEVERIEQWFDSYMVRVSQWFVMNTRWITIVFAVLIAFALHLDSLQLLERIQNDSEVRSRLSAMSSALLDQTPDAIAAVEHGYQEAVRDVLKVNTAQFNKGTAADDLSGVKSRTAAEDWIRQHAPEAAQQGLIGKFHAALEPRLSSALDKSIDRARTLESNLASAGITLLPGEAHGWKCYLSPASGSHLLGVLVSVLFLSLGAPFWFNTLNSLTSLKSTVAQKAQKEEEERKPAPPASGTQAGPAARSGPQLVDGPGPSATAPNRLIDLP